MDAVLEKRGLEVVHPENMVDPHPLYHHLRATDPVHWSEMVQAWFVTKHEDVMACFKDPRFSAVRTQMFAIHQLRGAGGPELLKDYIDVQSKMMLMKDGEDHTRLRRHANPRFTIQVIDDFRPTIRRIVDELLTKAQDAKQMDLSRDFAEPLPLRVIMELFDIPQKDREEFRTWSNTVVHYFGAATGDPKEAAIKANTAMAQLREYMTGIIHERRAKPGRDMLSLLIQAQSEGRIDEDEVVASAILILPAGHVTTVDQITNGVHALLTHPDQLRKLKENPALMRSAVEEILRYGPAVPFMHRIAKEDVELRGRTIKAGQLVFLGLSAASRDPAVFKDPDTFDITRESNRHLAFGFGPHTCLGAALARREVEIAIEMLFQRMPNLSLDEQKPVSIRCNSLVFRGFESLPVRW